MGNDSARIAILEYLIGFTARFRRRFGYFELAVKAAQSDIVVGHTAYQREDNALPAFFCSDDLRACGLALAADLAPQVDFPAGAEEGFVAVIGAFDGGAGNGVFLFGDVVAQTDLREELRTGDAIAAGIFIDAGASDHQILVFAQRGGDQIVEHRVVELFPPGAVGQVFGCFIADPPALRGVDDRPEVVRPDHAAAAGQGEQGDSGRGKLTHDRWPP